ncbi:tyrosine-protein kinase receptor TYRO3 isoform X2 [Gouania willdenowi]|uniref:tyrosine-protein kinase receptor TYRO3 isoform X2 n=1 Tax=Gouania willdenowi TaxID=441366 RepID=UPI001055AB60|nr:tyrosine-protein kinase receptor TYRO3 isoform X2 [Gouania willdenowi]
MKVLLLFLLLWVHSQQQAVLYTKQPSNQTVSQGNEVHLGCAIEGVADPDIRWMKDGRSLFSTDQVFLTLGEKHWETSHSVRSVQQQDAGQYWCEVEFQGRTFSSERAWITVEGVPHFLSEPEDVATFPDTPFNLSCSAVGPPEPVEVLWWVGGAQEGGASASPSILHVPGVNISVKFYCEAKNTRGISVSRTGTVHIKVLPEAPFDLHVFRFEDNNFTLSWKPGFNGHSALCTCNVQVSPPPLSTGPTHFEVKVPPHSLQLIGLRSHCNYSVRVLCSNEVGASPFSPWLHFSTPERVPLVAPGNLTFDLSEQLLSLRWRPLQEEELQGKLRVYRLQWTQAGETQEPLLFKESQALLSGASRFLNASFRVCACTAVGCGPWSSSVLVLPPAVSVSVRRSHVGVALLLALLTVCVFTLMMMMVARHREKETQFGSAFKDAESSVSFTAAQTFSRNNREQLEFTWEFGSVREAFLKCNDSSVLKVAVKVLKSDVTSCDDIEQCLKEAAYIKEFNHPNVIKLIGVSLHSRPGVRLPVPMLLLPFMKHGDLHTFLLLSRIGEQPFELPVHSLLSFMLDICRGMDYLSGRSLIHRDLAARNCMLGEDLRVCVADFGLSKRIYSGDYYRQGSVSKLPVKWIALESLADNVYTTQSDVWSFGVTMWEILTRGQTPYPGVENSEIYEFLIKGERLKKPPACRDDLYQLMHQCWSPVPKCRPTFQQLLVELERLVTSLKPSTELLYVNLQGAGPLPQQERDWLMGSDAALAIREEYRYTIGGEGDDVINV